MLWLYLLVFAVVTAALCFLLLWVVVAKEPVSEASSSASDFSDTDKTSKWILMAVAILVPMLSLVVYQQRGAADEVNLVRAMQALGTESGAGSMEPVIEFQRQLESMTEDKPERAEYWFLLGGLHMEMKEYQSAISAYQTASDLFPEDASIHSRLAEAQFVADGYVLSEAVRAHIDRVLASDPYDVTVLGILGISAYRAGQYEGSIRFWQKSLEALPPNSAAGQSIRASIEQAQIAAAGASGGADDGAVVASSTSVTDSQRDAAPSAGLYFDLDVSLGGSIAADPETSVFVFARQFGGPPMPVVVQRITLADLPLRLRMDDSKVMIPGRKLADFEQLELVARLSYSGSPTAVAGDYEKVIGPINPSEIDGPVSLEISDLVTD